MYRIGFFGEEKSCSTGEGLMPFFFLETVVDLFIHVYGYTIHGTVVSDLEDVVKVV